MQIKQAHCADLESNFQGERSHLDDEEEQKNQKIKLRTHIH